MQFGPKSACIFVIFSGPWVNWSLEYTSERQGHFGHRGSSDGVGISSKEAGGNMWCLLRLNLVVICCLSSLICGQASFMVKSIINGAGKYIPPPKGKTTVIWKESILNARRSGESGSIIQVALCQFFTFFHVMNANIFVNDSRFPLPHWTFTFFFFFLRIWIFPPSFPLFFFCGKLEYHCFRSSLSVLYVLCSL